jgi:putative addiction module killer protein
MIINCRTAEYYIKPNGKIPYKEWKVRLDKAVQAKVDIRVKRAEKGNYGKHRRLSGNIIELKFDDGTRVYFAEDGNEIILLLLGGNKTRQDVDIATAGEYYEDYKARNKG